MNMRTRKALGCFVLLTYIAIYAVLAASLGVALVPVIPTWAQLIFYADRRHRLDLSTQVRSSPG